MKRDMLDILVCPDCRDSLDLDLSSIVESQGEVVEGELICSRCSSRYPITNYVPRLVPAANYASSFGFQWQKHARTQIDSFSGTTVSRDRFFRATNWPERLDGQTILEAGCGAGRFTEIALSTGAEVFSFDYSAAVDVNLNNNGLSPNLYLAQADIYRVPFREQSFDKVFCFGVLQHCPDVKGAFLSLCKYLRKGGEIVVDVYYRSPRLYLLNPKYWLRPVTKRLPPELLYRLVEAVVPVLLPVRVWMTRLPYPGRFFARFIPVANYHGKYPLSSAQLLEWSILDTFDMLSPRYDQPQRLEDVREWFDEAGLINVRVGFGPNGINGKGIKP